jgi:hypothetical protein
VMNRGASKQNRRYRFGLCVKLSPGRKPSALVPGVFCGRESFKNFTQGNAIPDCLHHTALMGENLLNSGGCFAGKRND